MDSSDFEYTARRLVGCYEATGSVPSSFDESSDCWTHGDSENATVETTVYSFEPFKYDDPPVGTYSGSVSFEMKGKNVSFDLNFDYTGEAILGNTGEE